MDELAVILAVIVGLFIWTMLTVVRKRRALERKRSAELPTRIDEYLSELDAQTSDDAVDQLRRKKGLD